MSTLTWCLSTTSTLSHCAIKHAHKGPFERDNYRRRYCCHLLLDIACDSNALPPTESPSLSLSLASFLTCCGLVTTVNAQLVEELRDIKQDGRL